MKEQALEIARRQLQEISETCLRNNIQFTVIFLPTKLDVDDRSSLQKEKDTFGLTDADRNINQELKESLIGWLGRQNVKYLDLTNRIRGKSDALFWVTDYHLNVKGHKAVADVLYDDAGFIPR